MHVGFTGAEVATLNRVGKQAINAVTITLIVLCGVDATLRRN